MDADAHDQNSGQGDQQKTKLAPSLAIPRRAFTSVEHPCIIKNVDKGIKSLGGEVKLSKALRSKPTPVADKNYKGPDFAIPEHISASLRPDDPLAKRLLATPVTTNNLLLKITVPKRTGRRRKKGTNDPFLPVDPDATTASTSNNAYVDASTIFRSIKDNESKYTVTPVGVINETHRFRALPDLQWTSSDREDVTKIRDNLMSLDYNKIKEYKFETAPGPDPSKGIPVPPNFFQMPVAYHYKYQQNPFVKYTGDDRNEINTQKRLAADGYHLIDPTEEHVPKRPKPHIPPESTLTDYVKKIIASIRAQLRIRPIITRHILFNTIGWDKRDRIREAAVYCGYFFSSGPWRECLILWGLDPRKDPFYRQYQTVSYISFLKTGKPRHGDTFDEHVRELANTSTSELDTQHIFDGVTVSRTGNLFQFCDITDPLIRKILDTKDIRDTCAPTYPGWYHIGTWAKATVITKDKMNKIIGGEKPDDALYQRILKWPEIWDDKAIKETYKHELYDKDLKKEKAPEHTVMYSVRCAARNPRYAFGQMERREKDKEKGKEQEKEKEKEKEQEARASVAPKGVVPAEPEPVGEKMDIDVPEKTIVAEEAAVPDEEAVPEEEEDVPEDMTEDKDTADAILREGEDDIDSEDEEQDIFDGDEDEDSLEDGEYDSDDGDDALLLAMGGAAAADPVDDSEEERDAAERRNLPFGGLYP